MTIEVGDIVKHNSGAIGTVNYIFTNDKYVKIKIIQYEGKSTLGKTYEVLRSSLVKIAADNYIKE